MEQINEETITFTGAPMATKGNEIKISKMSLNKIKLGRNSRANIDKDELEGLMESIKSIGLLQPIGVVKNGTGYNIAYGNRRFLACSKLGMSHIPVIIHTAKKTSEIDIKNLAENVQRKNISLMEVGRYVSLLKGEGMTAGEIAVRLGTTRSYIDTAHKCYGEVPKEFRESIAEVTSGKKPDAGKIAPSTALRIMNASRTYRLSNSDEKKLFEEAKSNENFEPKMMEKYAQQLKGGNKDLGKIRPMKHMRVQFMIAQADYDKLQVKYVDDGPFSSVTAVFKAAMRGEISLAGVKLLDE